MPLPKNPCANLVEEVGIETQSSLWHLACSGDRAEGQPAAVREHGSDWEGKGVGESERTR